MYYGAQETMIGLGDQFYWWRTPEVTGGNHLPVASH